MTEAAALLAGYPPLVQSLSNTARKVISAALPDAEETVDLAGKVIGYGVGPGYAGLVCTIIPSKGGIKIGLPGSATWPDPDGLLEGTGKKHKYVACNTAADVNSPALKRLLAYALKIREP